MKPTHKITGADAIRLAERDNLTMQCYANPSDDGGVGAPNVARQIAKEDPSLIFVTVEADGWWDGSQRVSEMRAYSAEDYFNESGMYLGPDEKGVEPAWSDAE